ncbi:hypothetical protein J6590_082263 [Homalodisca vitripennis]|nr:hypothetical protein J6590_082263 [Homalodisca vitripennis]
MRDGMASSCSPLRFVGMCQDRYQIGLYCERLASPTLTGMVLKERARIWGLQLRTL